MIVAFVISRFRRRRTDRQRDHDTTVAATLPGYGPRRQDLIEPDDHHPVNCPRTGAIPSGSGNSGDVGMINSPSMSLSGINSAPVSAGGFSRHPHNPVHPVHGFGQTYNPYADRQGPYQHADPGPNNTGGITNFSVPSGSGVGLPFFAHSQQDSIGSSEPLLGANSDMDTSPEPAIPSVPARNPLRLTGGAGNTPDEGSSNETTGYRYDDDVEYEALRKGSLKVHRRSYLSLQLLTVHSRFETTRISFALLKRHNPCDGGFACLWTIYLPFSSNSSLFTVMPTGIGDYIFLFDSCRAVIGRCFVPASYRRTYPGH